MSARRSASTGPLAALVVLMKDAIAQSTMITTQIIAKAQK